ncbi:MAG: TRAFs-binding domain-containing protein [Mycobacterium sp.]
MPQTIAFMVMPFGVKPVGLTDPSIPATIDFDALWERAYEPALSQIGYQAVRADRDLGALIISEMIQRLAIADLVLADVTLPNANVYYELGVRHAAQHRGCVLVAADWARPMFDLAQMRQARFPLPDSTISADDAQQTVQRLVEQFKPLIDGTSPVFDAIPGYPSSPDQSVMSAFRSAVDDLASFQAEVRAVNFQPVAERARAARAIIERYGDQPAVRESVTLRLLRVVRDTARDPDDWRYLLQYIERLPAHLARQPLVLEYRALALAKQGDVAAAASTLEQLIADHGGTPERFGLLGGRYKDLMRNADTPQQKRSHLNKAIESYEKGMRLDLNDYYPATNLPRLYRQRGSDDDLRRAGEAAVIATEACRRAVSLGLSDEWTKSTLLGMAFYRGDVVDAEQLKSRVEDEGPGAWQLDSTLRDLGTDVEQQDDPAIREALSEILAVLRQLL